MWTRTDPDPIRPDPEPTRIFGSTHMGLKFLDPKDPDPRRPDPDPTRGPECPGLVQPVILMFSLMRGIFVILSSSS